MEIKSIGIVGAGRIGVPIASALARSGHEVHLVDLKIRDEQGKSKQEQWIHSEIKEDVDLLTSEQAAPPGGIAAVWGRIHLHHGIGEWLRQVDFIIEALPETREAKEPFYTAVRPLIPKGTINSSTTSTFSPDELAAWVPEPHLFMGVHWFNPVLVMPLVEIGIGAATDPSAVDAVKALLARAGKVPAVCRPQAGYIMPRIQVAVMNEAVRMVEEGVAPPEEIDKAFSNSMGFRYAMMGLLEFTDWGGVDVLYHAGNYLYEKFGDPKFKPPETIARLVAEGAIGPKTGRGIYDWTMPERQNWEVEKKRQFIRFLRYLGKL